MKTIILTTTGSRKRKLCKYTHQSLPVSREKLNNYTVGTSKRKKKTKLNGRIKSPTLATRLMLRYLIIRTHPAINAIPKIIPVKIPEIKPIFQHLTPNFPEKIRTLKQNIQGQRPEQEFF